MHTCPCMYISECTLSFHWINDGSILTKVLESCSTYQGHEVFDFQDSWPKSQSKNLKDVSIRRGEQDSKNKLMREWLKVCMTNFMNVSQLWQVLHASCNSPHDVNFWGPPGAGGCTRRVEVWRTEVLLGGRHGERLAL